MDYHRVVKILFDYFHIKIFRSNYSLDLDREIYRTMIDNFRKLIEKHYPPESVDVNFMLLYFSWTFNYWNNCNIQNTLTLGWIIGPKMFKRFFNRNRDSDDFVGREVLREYSISIDYLRALLKDEEAINHVELNPLEEAYKGRFTDSGRLYTCLVYTTLFNHQSNHCITCNSRDDCRRILKEKYPNIYKKRGYLNEPVKA